VDLRAKLLERMDVRVDAASPDDVPARRRNDRVAEAREQRTCKQDGGANTPAQFLVELGLRDAGRADAHVVRADPLDLDAQIDE